MNASGLTVGHDTVKLAAPRVLVVDDEEPNRDLLARLLKRNPYRVETAARGEEALELLGEKPFDLVLLDIMMPGMSGIEVLKQMKDETALEEIPVIMITALDSQQRAVECIRTGAEDYLTKPLDQHLLQARVESSLERKRLRDQQAEYRRQLDLEKRRSNDLLLNLFPFPVYQALQAGTEFTPRRYENVAVLFCDIVGFTTFCDDRDPVEVVDGLQRLFEVYETISRAHQIEKIKTIGDAYMAAANIVAPVADPVLNCVECGIEMIEAARTTPPHWDLRVGIHCGPVVAGVVGHERYTFDLWGDTVNTAARVESHGDPGAVSVSAKAWLQIEHLARGQRQSREIKGKGVFDMVRFKGFLG